MLTGILEVKVKLFMQRDKLHFPINDHFFLFTQAWNEPDFIVLFEIRGNIRNLAFKN